MSNDVEPIIQEIRRGINEQIEATLSNAEEQAETIIQEAREEVEREIKKRVDPEVRRLRRRMVDKVEIEGRHSIVQAKEEILEKVRKKAREMLKAIADGENSQYDPKKILYKTIKEAAKKLDEDQLYISTNKQDTEYLKKNIENIQEKLKKDYKKVSLHVSDEPFNCIGGIKAENKEGTKTFYNTLEGRLDHSFNQFKTQLNKVLFKEVQQNE